MGEGWGEGSSSDTQRTYLRTTIANRECGIRTGEAFGVRLSFLALSDAMVCPCARSNITPHCQAKAAEGTAALHDAGARLGTPLVSLTALSKQVLLHKLNRRIKLKISIFLLREAVAFV